MTTHEGAADLPVGFSAKAWQARRYGLVVPRSSFCSHTEWSTSRGSDGCTNHWPGDTKEA